MFGSKIYIEEYLENMLTCLVEMEQRYDKDKEKEKKM